MNGSDHEMHKAPSAAHEHDMHHAAPAAPAAHDHAHDHARDHVHDHMAMGSEPQRRATAYFSLEGMCCDECAQAAEKVLRDGAGVIDAQVSFTAGKGRLDYDPRAADIDELVERVENLGYSVRLTTSAESAAAASIEEGLLTRVLVAFAFGMQEMVLYIVYLYPAYAAGNFTGGQLRTMQFLAWLLATPVLAYGGFTFLSGTVQELKMRMPGMDTLVALGTLSAYGYSVWATLVGGLPTYFDSVAMIVQFVILGRYLEAAGGARARKDVQGLLELQPQRVWVRLPEGTLEHLSAKQVGVGQTIVVKPGERVPLDIEITEGAAHADESLLTGESTAVAKGVGDTAWAGTQPLDGVLTGVVVHALGESRLSGIRMLVERSLAHRAPVQRLADQASFYLSIGVISLALVTGIAWALSGATPQRALITAVAVLVVACPCALGLATPLAVSVSLGGAARRGVLVRNGAVLETAGQIGKIVLDKTGTVTLGRLEISATEGVFGVEPATVLASAAAVEQYSEHPLARAITAAYPAPPRAREFASLPGVGVAARMESDGALVEVGGPDRGADPGVPAPVVASAATHAAQGETVVWVRREGAVIGFIALRDELAPSALAAVRQLDAVGIEPILLSGDSEETTRAVAAELGIRRFEARLMPEQKAEHLKAVQAEGVTVAMVGDGVNDAPSLAVADLSVTVAGGADIAGHTSDLVLNRADLTLVPWFIRAAAQVRRVIRQNLGWAFAYNVVALPLAALGIITPAIAAVAMASSSLLVVGNSLRLKRMLRRT